MGEVEGVGEQHLMRGVIESMKKKQIGSNKQDGITSNVTVTRKMGLQVGNRNVKERKSVQINHEGMEEDEIDDGPEVPQLWPNKRKWKRQAREQN